MLPQLRDLPPFQDQEELLRRIVELFALLLQSPHKIIVLTISNPKPPNPVLLLMVIIPTKVLWQFLAGGCWLWYMPEHTWPLVTAIIIVLTGEGNQSPSGSHLPSHQRDKLSILQHILLLLGNLEHAVPSEDREHCSMASLVCGL